MRCAPREQGPLEGGEGNKSGQHTVIGCKLLGSSPMGDISFLFLNLLIKLSSPALRGKN